MTVLRILSTLALAGVVQALRPDFEHAHKAQIDAEFLPTAILLPRLRAREPTDVMLLTAEGLTALVDESLVQPDSPVDLARSFIGVAVRLGAPQPDITTPDAFKAALLGARSIALSKQGASGLFLAGLFQRLGIADAITAKATIIESGFTAELAARGEVELALQQVSELLVVPGIQIVGRLPKELGGNGVFSGGISTAAHEPNLARTFLKTIAEAGLLLTEKGLEPIAAGSPKSPH